MRRHAGTATAAPAAGARAVEPETVSEPKETSGVAPFGPPARGGGGGGAEVEPAEPPVAPVPEEERNGSKDKRSS